MDSQHNGGNDWMKKSCKEMTDDEFRKYLEYYLEYHGWKRDKAGEDWDRALQAFFKSARMVEPRKRGILVTGTCGCGKTAFLDAALSAERTPTRVFRLANRAALAWVDYESEDYDRDAYEKIFAGNLYLDDLGAECLTNSYGIKRDLVGELITEFHYRGTGRLHITTNLSPGEMLERYGGRVTDRLKDLCVPVAFKGTSKRKWVA